MGLRACDVMQSRVLSVSASMSLAELADFLITHRIGGVPVVERGGRLAGIVSRSDLVRSVSLERSLAGLVPARPDAGEFAPGEHADLPVPSVLGEMADRTVRDIMVADPVTVTPDAPIREVASLMVTRHLHRLVVVDEGRVCGVISTLDLVRLIADERLHD